MLLSAGRSRPCHTTVCSSPGGPPIVLKNAKSYSHQDEWTKRDTTRHGRYFYDKTRSHYLSLITIINSTGNGLGWSLAPAAPQVTHTSQPPPTVFNETSTLIKVLFTFPLSTLTSLIKTNVSNMLIIVKRKSRFSDSSE